MSTVTRFRVEPLPGDQPAGSILPGLREAAGYGAVLVVAMAAIMAGLVLLGCLVAWLLADGPQMPRELAPVMRRTGIGMGLYAWVAGVVGYAWGRWSR